MMLFGPNSLTDEQYAALHAQASEVSQPVRYAGFIQAHLEPKSPIGSYETALERFLRRQEAQRKVKQKYGARADSAVKDDDFNAR